MTNLAAPSKSLGDAPAVDRRTFLSTAAAVSMAGAVTACYGSLAAFAARFLYPAGEGKKSWHYVGDARQFRVGESLLFRTPSGIRAAIPRRGDSGDATDFVALSSTCPHLGCQVHWEAVNSRFFCPCHNGTFDISGKATGGPPARAGQSLKQFKLKIERGMLFIETPDTSRAGAETASVSQPYCARPGHDPCLFRDADTGDLTA